MTLVHVSLLSLLGTDPISSVQNDQENGKASRCRQTRAQFFLPYHSYLALPRLASSCRASTVWNLAFPV